MISGGFDQQGSFSARTEMGKSICMGDSSWLRCSTRDGEQKVLLLLVFVSFGENVLEES